MKTKGLNLLIPDKPDVERDAVARAFESGGGAVHRIARFWDPPEFDLPSVRVYGADAFCLVLQQKLGFSLCSPSDELLLEVPSRFLNRLVVQHTLGEIPSIQLPAFIKPVTPKQFRGAIYETGDSVASECRGLPAETAIFVSEPVIFTIEVRSFVLEGRVLDAAIYEGATGLEGAVEFLEALTKSIELPRTVVVDIGFVEDRGWAVIEFNAAWGAGLNGCDAAKVLPAILSASSGVDA